MIRNDSHRAWFVLFSLFLVCSSALAENTAFVRIPGVAGTSVAAGRNGWSELDQHELSLGPPTIGDKKIVLSQCTATLGGALGAAAAQAVALIGVPLAGDVLIEVQNNDGQTFYRATLKGALITHYGSTVAGTFHDSLSMVFSQIVLSIRQQRPDGSLDSAQVGSFDCVRTP